MKVLIATAKPFAAEAVQGIKKEFEGTGHEVVLLEKYETNEQLLDAVKDVDAMIVRSDKITAEVLDAAKNLKIVVRAGVNDGETPLIPQVLELIGSLSEKMHYLLRK